MFEREEEWLLKERFSGEKSEAFFAALARLRAGEPLAYLIGHTPFLGTTIYLDSHPLIPRPETEFWVETAIKVMRSQQTLSHPVLAQSIIAAEDSIRSTDSSLYTEVRHETVKVLDLCAGSGCIGVAVAKAIINTNVTFGEIDPAHVATIRKNCLGNDIPENRFHIVSSNLFQHIDGELDYILSNPPYIDLYLDRTQASVKNFEPHLALYGGKNGMEILERIIAGARAKLAPRGSLWLEHEPEQTKSIGITASKHGFRCTTHLDQYQTERYSILVLE